MKPNHTCKYSKCNLGENGERKKYYACNYCDRINSWHSVACCKEHYDLYVKEVLDARSEDLKTNNLPERLDKTEKEIKELYNEPVEKVLEETKEELKDYAVDGVLDVDAAVAEINAEIDSKIKTKTRKKGRV